MARVAPKNQETKIVTQTGTPQGRDNRTTILAAVVAAVLLGLVAIFLLTRGGDADLAKYEGIPQDGVFLGSAEAPVTVQEYLDFKCSHCRDAHQSVMPTIIEDYVKDGQVRVEFIPVGALSQESAIAAQAALCAADQNQFVGYYDQVFANYGSTMNIDNLTRYADAVGLDTGAFRACLTSSQTAQQVNDNTQALIGGEGGSTPTFVVNGDARVVGADLTGLKNAIDAALQ